MSSFSDFQYSNFMRGGKKLRGGDSTDGGMVALIVVLIIFLLFIIIGAACWGCSDSSSVEYVVLEDGTVAARKVRANKMKKLFKKGSKKYDAAGRHGPAPHYAGGGAHGGVHGGALKKVHAAAPRVHHLLKEGDAVTHLSGRKPTVVFVHMDGCGFCDRQKTVFTDELARQFPGVTLAAINANACRGLCKELGITGFPALIVNFGDHGGHLPRPAVHMGYKGPEVLHKLLAAAHGARAVHGGARIVVSPTAGAAAAHSAGGAVHELTSAESAMAALDGGEKGVLFIYAPWCGYCKAMKPIYDQLAAKHSKLKFYSINADAAGKAIVDKLVAAGKRVGFPTFLKNFGGKSGEEVSLGGRAKLLMHSGKKELAQFEAEVLEGLCFESSCDRS
jgi:thiol-disulfide isomerase/thioredoxin